MIKSLRLQLTAWYLALFSLLFVAFCVFLYGALGDGLRGRLDETLRSEVSTAAGLFEDELVEMHGDPLLAAKEAIGGTRFAGSLTAVLSDGRVLASNPRGAERALERIAILVSTSGLDAVTALPDYGKQGARALARRELAGGREFLILAVAPLDSIAAELRMVRRAVFIALPLILALAGIGGYLLASRSLAPLGWMARQAREIGGSSLHKRLEIGEAAQELTALAASFNELLARLDQSFESMRRFVADASHELRTPVSVIRGEAGVALARDRDATEYRASLAIVLDESRRLSRLVDDLLNLARADSGHVRLETTEFYFNDLLAECCNAARSRAGKPLELECNSAADAPFRGDEELLRRLVNNLLDNAIRYTPEGGRISAGLKLNGSTLEVQISDCGCGIRPEDAPRIFDRFYRADQSRSRQDGGFGLGLSIVKWIAEAHHGTVAVSSQPGAGSTFIVSLPR